MEKINVVLVVLNNKLLEPAISTLNFERVNLIAVIVENPPNEFLLVGEKQIPVAPFSVIQKLLDAGKKFFWLISGFVNDLNDLYNTKKFLVNNGIPEENIINFEILSSVNGEFIANLRYIEKNGADFFATGNDYIEVGLNLNCIPHARGRGVNLACSNQDLRQGYLTAKHVFEHVAPGSIKFVLIGLSPDSFHYDSAENFSTCSSDFQYMLALKNFGRESFYDFLLKNLVSDGVKNIFATITSEQADLNLDYVKKIANAQFHAKSVINWETELDNLKNKLSPQIVQKNIQILKDYIKLCHENGAKPIGVVFPFAPAVKKNYDAELLNFFQSTIHQLENFECIDLTSLDFDYDYFYDMTHLNAKGAAVASSRLGLKLYEENLLLIENFLDMNYEYFRLLAQIMPKDNYNALMEQVFKLSIQKIRRKDKINVGFVMIEAAHWCGDDLYNFFANDDRFEPTIFFSMDFHKDINELVEKDFWRGVEQLKSHGLNVVPDRKSVV